MGVPGDYVSGSSAFFDVGYIVNYYTPNSYLREITQLIDGKAFDHYTDAVPANQIFTLGVNCVLSAGYQPFVSTITLLGHEAFMRTPDAAFSSLYYANTLYDNPSYITIPIQYIAAPTASASTIGNGLTIVSAPIDNQLYYALLSRAAALVVLN
jgi:hypothetical protein